MIEREILVNTKLRHPNIVQFLATAKCTSAVYLVSEFIQGSNMDDAIFDPIKKMAMGIKPEHKIDIIKQVMQGIAYMHSLSPMVLHHDIKPGNILIKEHCFTTKLCDLGVSRVKSLLAATTTTSVGSVPGTPSFMAPECLLGEDTSSASSDVWSLGITMIEFFTERDAWNIDGSLTPVDDIKKYMREHKSPLSPDDTIPMEIRSWIDLCISYDVHKRPDVIDILQSFKQQHQV
jgi:serine/threonine protein kinase